MNKSKCPLCGSNNTIKYGCRKGRQSFRCNDCGYRFRNSKLPSDVQIWHLYTELKQTISQLATELGVSDSTIKRRPSKHLPAMDPTSIAWRRIFPDFITFPAPSHSAK